MLNKETNAELLDDNTFLLEEISTDPEYGYTKDKAIKVGGWDKGEGPLNERRFLNALAGPNGKRVSYYRAGSCSPKKYPNGKRSMLDFYKVTWEGSMEEVTIYINMYEHSELKAPLGFTIKNKTAKDI